MEQFLSNLLLVCPMKQAQSWSHTLLLLPTLYTQCYRAYVIKRHHMCWLQYWFFRVFYILVLRVLYSILFLTDQRLFNCRYFDDVCLRKDGSIAYITQATTTARSADQLTINKRIENKEQSRINCLRTIALDLKLVLTLF